MTRMTNTPRTDADRPSDDPVGFGELYQQLASRVDALVAAVDQHTTTLDHLTAAVVHLRLEAGPDV